ncbi:MAG: hypothetical protein JWN18_717 [Parcubacteria group bacterium]|nr:hypothetical protein [Parcubacteria group bacterium]
MKILIVGGGIGGLTLGAFLQDTEIEFEIVEKAKEPLGGYLLVMWDNARDVLAKLGLAEKFDTEGTPIHHYMMRTGSGELLRDYNLKDFNVNYGSAITMIARKDLCEWLTGKIGEGKISRGVTMTAIEQKAAIVRVTLSNGEIREYDAVIGADGVHSSVREMLFKKHVESYENWRSWWVWIDRDKSASATVTEYVEPKEFTLVFSGREKALAILTAPVDHKIWDTPEGRIDRLRTVFKDESVLVPEIFESLKDTDVMPADLIEVRVREWVKGRVAIMGDAAHSFGPHAGLGGSMAMEDAYILAGELLKVNENVSVEKALINYQKIRRPRIVAAKRLNERMRFYTLIKSNVVRKLANTVMKLLPEQFLVGQYARLLREEI